MAVAVDIPRLELDRPFTYLLGEEHLPGTGLLVSVPFHGRTVRGWVLGPTDDVPGRVARIRRVLSKVPLFDPRSLELYRWMSQRYVAPLVSVIDRAHPPRVASEEDRPPGTPARSPEPVVAPDVLGHYGSGGDLVKTCREGAGAFALRPLPDEEAAVCVEAVAACLDGGRDAVVLVPEAEPLPATAVSILDAFGGAAVAFLGGDRRGRYRTWLDIGSGRYRVVVGTRSAVFAPLRRLGLLWVNREIHPGHREERAPYHHVREVALARAELQEAVCVLAGHVTSAETVALVAAGRVVEVRASRQRERAVAPLVEIARPGREERSPRLTRLLREAGGAFLMASRHGYGVVRVCRDCGEPVRCASCGGPVGVALGRPACTVCGAEAACAACGSTRFGVDRRGTERLQEWAAGVTGAPVLRVDSGDQAVPPGPGRVVVGTAAAVKDFGAIRVPLVAIVDADLAHRRAGLGTPEQALATWMEAAIWVGPRAEGGRVLVHARETGDPAVQSLVRWDPGPLHRAGGARRTEAGFPPGFPVFRVLGSPELPDALAALTPVNLLASTTDGETVCLVTVRPEAVPAFHASVVSLAERGTVARVEADPQL